MHLVSRSVALGLLAVGCAQEPSRDVVGRQYAPIVDEPAPSPTSRAVAANMAFRAWLDGFKQTAPESRGALVSEGRALARERRVLLVPVMRVDPELALSMAVSMGERRMLPPEVQEHVERWRDGRGMVHVIAGTGEETRTAEVFVSFDGTDSVLRTSLYGRRLAQATQDNLRLHGIELDGVFALLDLPVRRLPPDDAALFDYRAGSPCPTSRKPSTAAEIIHDGDQAVGFCQPIHAQAYGEQLIDEETAAALETAASVWTEGPKTVLFMRVDFDDRVGDPISLASSQALINTNVNNFFTQQSFGKTTLTGVFPPTLRMPRPAEWYRDAGNYFQLLSDARVASRDAGFDPGQYNLDIIAHPGLFGGWLGRGYVGGKGTWLNGNFSQGVTAHELGHNYGAYHANFWNAGESIIGGGTQGEYGNPFDVMGSSGASHFNVWFKRGFDWTTANQVQTLATSGTYRIYPLEVATPDGGLQALKLPRNDSQSRDYWVEFRQLITGNIALMNGASLNFGFPSLTTSCPTNPSTGCGSHLLDMTPGVGSASNSPLVIGRTFSDPTLDVHFTPVGKGGTTPQSLDVVVNFGPYPTNLAPVVSVMASATTVASGTAVTFTATASDPNGDPLAYAWDFDDGSFSVDNLPVQTKMLTGNRVFQVRCTVSDMKGHTATTGVFVTVGTPTTFTVSGSVSLSDAGLDGVRVSDGTRVTYSLSDGTWALTNVPASLPDGGGVLTINAAKFDLAMTRQFTVPVTVAANVPGLVFTAATKPGYNITGRVTAGGSGVVGVTVSSGTRTATTNANGDFSITNVPNGRHLVTATKPGWVFALSGSLRNPIEVLGGNAANVNFFAQGVTINGQLPSTLTTAPVVTDGQRTVTATRGATTQPWFYNMSGVPNGTWNITATSPGVTLVADNFTNPVTIAGVNRNLNFRVGTTTTTYQVTGTVRTGATPLPGVSVSDGTRSSTADSLGRYVLHAVPAGALTVTPTRAGYTFMPANRMVTVSTASLANVDFDTTTVNAPPTFAMAPRASMSPTTGTTVQLTALGADDTGEPALTYEWVAQQSSWPVTFSTNASNAAKTVTATFSGGGSYTIEAVATDPGGLSVRATVVVVVTQVGVGLMVTPASANVTTGATAFFNGQGRDQFGRSMWLGSPVWSVSGGGTIDTAGRFTAGLSPGGPHTVTAVAGGFTAMATLTVVGGGAPTLTQPARAQPSPVVGTMTLLTVRATDDAGEASLRYDWSTLVAPMPVVFSANGTNAAKDTTATFSRAGDYDFLVTITDTSGNVITSVVRVTVEVTPTTVTVSPTSASVAVNDTEPFMASIDDQFGDLVTPLPPVSWRVSGGGTIDSAGLFTAGTAAGGPFTVTATVAGEVGTAQVTVVAMADTQPPAVQLTAPVNNTRVSGRVTLVATATDNVGVTRVEFFEGTTSLGVATQAPWQLEVDTATWSDGLKSLTARARDAAGNSTTSDIVVVIIGMSGVDVAPPVVTVTAPTAGAETGSQVSFTAEATDDIGVVRVEFEVDGALVSTDTGSPYEASSALQPGAHTVVAIAHDAAGKSTRSAAVTFTVRGVVDPDGGTVIRDAGTEPVADGGSTDSDGGGTTERPGREGVQELVTGACGCSGGVGSLSLLGVLAVFSRRRRR